MQRADAALRQLPVQYSGASISEPPHRRMVNIETDPDAAYRGQEIYERRNMPRRGQTAVLESTAFPFRTTFRRGCNPLTPQGRQKLEPGWQPSGSHEEAKRPRATSATPAAARKIALPSA